MFSHVLYFHYKKVIVNKFINNDYFPSYSLTSYHTCIKPVTNTIVIRAEFSTGQVRSHLLVLISVEKVASNWTYHLDDLQLCNNGCKEMDVHSGNGGHNRPVCPSLVETATGGFIDSCRTFVRPRFVLGRVNNWGILVAVQEAGDFKPFHFGLLAEISLWVIACSVYDL